MSQSRRKPDFLVIGVQKSATTWLQERLRQHPDIFMTRDELHYFDRDENFARGDDWYLAHFDGAQPGQLVGEKTPDYIWTNVVDTPGISPEKHLRIRDFNPDFKLIVIFREPVARFTSALHHNHRLGRLPTRRSIAELKQNPAHARTVQRMLDRGLYATQLQSYFDIFPREQIKVLFHDDVSADPDATLAEVQQFLGVEPLPFTESNAKRYNDYKATEFGARLLGPPDSLSSKIIMRLDRYIFSKLPFEKVAYPKLDEAEKAELHQFYAPEMQRFQQLIERPLPAKWGY